MDMHAYHDALCRGFGEAEAVKIGNNVAEDLRITDFGQQQSDAREYDKWCEEQYKQYCAENKQDQPTTNETRG